MLNTAAGIDLEPVLNRSLPISIGCSKSFRQSNMLFYPEHIADGSIPKAILKLLNGLLYTYNAIFFFFPRTSGCKSWRVS